MTPAFLRLAFALAISGALSLLVAQWLHVELRGLWIVLSAVLIVKTAWADSLAIARDQLLGTTVGVCSGALFGLMPQAVLSVALAIFLTALVCAVVPTLRGVINVACVAAALVIVLPSGDAAYVTAWHRFIDTMIGAAIALLVGALMAQTVRWWPSLPQR